MHLLQAQKVLLSHNVVGRQYTYKSTKLDVGDFRSKNL